VDKLLILYIAGGVGMILLSIPLLNGRIPPNSWYGFRVPKTLNNPEIWYAANRYAAKRLLAAGVSLILTSVGLYNLPGITIDTYALGCLAVFAIVFGVGLIQSFMYLRGIDRG